MKTIERIISDRETQDFSLLKSNEDKLFDKLKTYDLNEIQDLKLKNNNKRTILEFLILINAKRTFGDKEFLDTFFQINGEFDVYNYGRLLQFLDEFFYKKSPADFFKFAMDLFNRKMNLLPKMNFDELEFLLLGVKFISQIRNDLYSKVDLRFEKDRKKKGNR